MNSAESLTWWEKAIIGALGGLGLAILKLIDAKFFLGKLSSVEAAAAYLTYFCYMFLGSLASVFFCDHELTLPKMKKSAFILGLLAPSVLIAIVNSPLKQSAEQSNPIRIPNLGGIFISSAYAQGPEKPPPKREGETSSNPAKVIYFSKAELSPSFSEAFYAALGVKQIEPSFALVVGSTTEPAKALEISEQIKAMFASSITEGAIVLPQVVKIEGKPNYYVTLGGVLEGKDRAASIKYSATEAALNSLGVKGSLSSKQTAALVLNAQVVNTDILLKATQ